MNSKAKTIIALLSLSLAAAVGLSVGLLFRSNGSPQPAYADTAPKAAVATAQTVHPVDFFSFREVAADVLQSVVEVDTVQIEEQTFFNLNPFDFMEDFFGNPNRKEPKKDKDSNRSKKEFRLSGLGSGVIVKKEKDCYYVLTNNHVVQKADEIKVTLNDGSKKKAKLVGRDPRIDLALISFVASEAIPVARLGNSDELEVGDWVLACGSPFGFMSTVTAGIISAKDRRGPDTNISSFLQTDAAINSGNSGGPLVNVRGEVVGINTWIATKTGESAGLGFSIPINNAKRVIDDFINDGEVVYGWLGLLIGDADEAVKKQLQLSKVKENGSLVHNVYLKSAANKYGLCAGDYLIHVNGEAFNGTNQLVQWVADLKPNQKVEFGLYRDGRYQTVRVTIDRRPKETDDEKTKELMGDLWPGISVALIDDELKNYFDLPDKATGVVAVSVESDSKAAGGLVPGDIIKSINDLPIATLSDFYKAIRIEKNRYLIEYERKGTDYYFGIKK